MASTETKPAIDPRYKLLDATMKRHQHRPDSLLEVLHSAQGLFGSLNKDLLRHVGRGLKLPMSRVYGVATFYHFFTFTPKAEHTCVVCLGTACYVKGAAKIVERMEKSLSVPVGQSRADGKASLQVARCFGACGLAPAGIFDGQVVGHLTEETAGAFGEKWFNHETR